MRKIQNQQGVVAVEALFSLMLLFVALIAMWGIGLVIYNQTKLNTATQLASQAGLVTINRTSYREPVTLENALRARFAAETVFRENVCGMFGAQFSSADPPGNVACNGNVFSGTFGPGTGFGTEITCGRMSGHGTYSASSCPDQIIRYRVNTVVLSPFSLRNIFFGNATTQLAVLQSQNSIYSATPYIP